MYDNTKLLINMYVSFAAIVISIVGLFYPEKFFLVCASSGLVFSLVFLGLHRLKQLKLLAFVSALLPLQSFVWEFSSPFISTFEEPT